jgi:MtN3 and saliva related transmembrane protein
MNDQLVQVIGIAAGICTAVSLLPQIIKILKEKKAEEISLAYLFVLLSGLVLWIVYGVLRKDIPVIATNALSIVLNLTMLGLGLKYKRHTHPQASH